MKVPIVCMCLVMTLAGCSSPESAFDKTKAYVERTALGSMDAGEFGKLIEPIFTSKDCIPFLYKKAKGSDPKDTILACNLLVTILDLEKQYPNPKGKDVVSAIQLGECSKQMDRITTNTLTRAWADQYSLTRRMIKELEPTSAGDAATRAAPEK